MIQGPRSVLLGHLYPKIMFIATKTKLHIASLLPTTNLISSHLVQIAMAQGNHVENMPRPCW